MPSATLLLLGRWPVTRAHNAHHELFTTHEMLSDRDLFATDFDSDQALRDILADGAVLSVAQRANMRVEVIAIETTPFLDGFGDMADAFLILASVDEVKAKLATPADDCLRIVVLPNRPLKKLADVSGLTMVKMAANSKVEQALALTDALDIAHGIVSSSVADTFVVAYGALRFRNNGWEVTSGTVAFLPSGRIAAPSPVSMTLIPTLLLQNIGVDASDNDLFHQETACLTIDARDDAHWTCTARLFFEKERYEVQHTFPARDIANLGKAFSSIQNPSDWLIRDNQGAVDNLADVAMFVQTQSSKLLAACLPAVRDLMRRRATFVPEEVLVQAETVAQVEEIVPHPEAPLITPEELTPTPSLDWRTRLLAMVKSVHGDKAVDVIDKALVEITNDHPHTFVFNDEHVVHKLQGALPPSLLIHLCKSARQIPLLTIDGHSSVNLLQRSGNVRIGHVKLNFENVIVSEWLVVYAGIGSKSTNDRTSRRDIRSHSNRGAVARFVKQYEIARALMHR